MDAQEIIRYISESEKKTPVRIFIKEKPGACVDYGTAKVFGAGDKIVFGDWKDLKPVLDANAEFIKGKKEEIQGKIGAEVGLDIIADPLLNDSQCIIETDGGIFDCSIDTELDNMIREIKALAYRG